MAKIDLEKNDEDIIHSDMTIDYKMSTFLLLHSDFWYNSINGIPESLIAS